MRLNLPVLRNPVRRCFPAEIPTKHGPATVQASDGRAAIGVNDKPSAK